jgi:AcrR family transcriptional regulator
VPGRTPPQRANQRYRTRKDLISAAARLMKDGRKPSLDEVAEAARVSRATAYRYFPNVEGLLVEASFDIAVPDAAAVFANERSMDPEERIDKAEAAMHRSVVENEAAIRLMLASTLARSTQRATMEPVPLRQNRRTPLIEAALAPVRAQLDDTLYARVVASLAMIFGPESMVVFRDVLRLDPETAREVKSWAARALVRAAVEQSRSGSNHPGCDTGADTVRSLNSRPGNSRPGNSRPRGKPSGSSTRA